MLFLRFYCFFPFQDKSAYLTVTNCMHMQGKHLLLKRMEDPTTTNEEIEGIYAEIDTMERTDVPVAFEGKNDQLEAYLKVGESALKD